MSRYSKTIRAINYDIDNASRCSSDGFLQLTGRLSFMCYRMKLYKKCNSDCEDCPFGELLKDFEIARKDLE